MNQYRFVLVVSDGGVPRNVCGIEDCQTLRVLGIGEVKILFKTDNSGVADVGSIEERAEKEEGKDRQNPVLLSVNDVCVHKDPSRWMMDGINYLVSIFHNIRLVI